MLRQVGNRAVMAARGVRSYHERVVDHYNHPRNVGSFDKNDDTVGTGLVGAPACGDVMKLQIRVDEETGKVVDSCFKTFGCGSAIASSSVASEWIKGRPVEEVVTIKNRFCFESYLQPGGLSWVSVFLLDSGSIFSQYAPHALFFAFADWSLVCLPGLLNPFTDVFHAGVNVMHKPF